MVEPRKDIIYMSDPDGKVHRVKDTAEKTQLALGWKLAPSPFEQSETDILKAALKAALSKVPDVMIKHEVESLPVLPVDKVSKSRGRPPGSKSHKKKGK